MGLNGPNPGSIGFAAAPDEAEQVRRARDVDRAIQEMFADGTLRALIDSLPASVAANVADQLAAGISTTTVTASGAITGSTDIVLNSGSVFSTYMLTHPVISGYFAAYFDGTGRLGITPSSRRFKRQIEPKPYTLDQIQRIQVVSYRLRAAYILYGDAARYEIGVIAEQLVDEGFPEFVLFDRKGRPASVAYDRLALVALQGVQQLTAELTALRAEIKALTEKVDTLG